MKVAEFDYELPPGCIAQRPAARRDASRLLVLDRGSGTTVDGRFDALPDWLAAGDLLVLNDTRVVRSRLVGRKPSGGRVELLVVGRETGAERWSCLLRASRAPQPGVWLEFGAGLRALVIDRVGDRWSVRFEAGPEGLDAALERVGRLPLPPYLARPEPTVEDHERYQTVFARHPGAVAAPTAGLHFTRALLDRLVERGVEVAYVTLHVGPATFQPVRTTSVEEHALPPEPCCIPVSTADAIARARARGGRIVAIGTTVVRGLEHRAREDGTVAAGTGPCDLFIYPGFRFRAVDELVTNFHLPRSTLLMLVCAFAGSGPVMKAYARAIELGYRFYSYGDAMLIRSAR